MGQPNTGLVGSLVPHGTQRRTARREGRKGTVLHTVLSSLFEHRPCCPNGTDPLDQATNMFRPRVHRRYPSLHLHLSIYPPLSHFFLAVSLQRLHFYRKTPADLTESTTSGGAISFVALVLMIYLFVSQLFLFFEVSVLTEPS